MVIDTSALLATAAVTPVPLEEPHVLWALEGLGRHGKGRHPAAINFDVCFSYGLARTLQSPLFLIGDDFAATDLEPALPG